MKLTVHTDGGARGNPGPAAVGVVVTDETGTVVFTIAKHIGDATNNVAEYMAVVYALEKIQHMKLSGTIAFVLDSVLVVNQLNGRFKVKDATLRELLTRVRILEQNISSIVSYSVVPREQNREADALVNKALDEFLMSR